MAANDVVLTFKRGRIDISVYETALGSFVAADQGGWIDGSWDTANEAMRGAFVANGLAPDTAPVFGSASG